MLKKGEDGCSLVYRSIRASLDTKREGGEGGGGEKDHTHSLTRSQSPAEKSSKRTDGRTAALLNISFVAFNSPTESHHIAPLLLSFLVFGTGFFLLVFKNPPSLALRRIDARTHAARRSPACLLGLSFIRHESGKSKPALHCGGRRRRIPSSSSKIKK